MHGTAGQRRFRKYHIPITIDDGSDRGPADDEEKTRDGPKVEAEYERISSSQRMNSEFGEKAPCVCCSTHVLALIPVHNGTGQIAAVRDEVDRLSTMVPAHAITPFVTTS